MAQIRLHAVFLALLVFFVNPASANIETAETEVAKSPAPAWVAPIEARDIPPENRSQTLNGTAYSLADTQVRVTAQGYEYFFHIVYEITDRSGLEDASRLSVEFDPQDSQLTYNRVHVIRDGKVQDRLPDLTFAILRQEDSLTDGIIDGTVTALGVLEDVAVGDIVETAYTLTVTSKLWPGHFFDDASLQWTVPVGRTYYRVIHPAGLTLVARPINGAAAPTVTRDGDTITQAWDVESLAPYVYDDNSPSWYVGDQRVELSSMASWQDVQAWATPLYSGDLTLPKDFLKKVKAIKKSWKHKEDRLTEALRLVQNDIRYVGIEIGINSHVPRMPAEVIRLGYGDCKDKSLLLAVVLKELGIDAWPALTDIDNGPGLDSLLPSPTAFDHVVVKAVIGKKTYWLDPTATHQGGRGDGLTPLPYGFALPVDGKAIGLEQITVPLPARPTFSVEEAYVIDEDADPALTLASTVTYTGADADYQRRSLAEQSHDAMNKSYLDYYTAVHPSIAVTSPVVVTDDLDGNIITLTAKLAQPKAAYEASKSSAKINLRAYSVNGLIPSPGHGNRPVAPVFMPFALNRTHTITIQMPGRHPRDASIKEESAGGASFLREIKSDGDTFSMRFSLATDRRTAPAEDAKAIADLSRTISDYANVAFYPRSVRKGYSFAGADQEALAKHQSKLLEATDAMTKKDYVGSLQILNVILEDLPDETPLRGLVQILRGKALAKLNRRTSSIKAFEEGISLYPDDADGYFQLAGLYYTNDDPAKAADTIARLVKQIPAKADNLNKDWLIKLSRKLYTINKGDSMKDLSLALAEAGYKATSDDKPEWIYRQAIGRSIEVGTPEVARPFVAYITDPGSLVDMLGDRSFEALWPEIEAHAGAGLRTAIDLNLAEKRRKHEESPNDFKALSAYMYALRSDGRFQEALDLAMPHIEDWNGIEAEADQGFWIVNQAASNAVSLGRSELAYELMEKIKAFPLEDYGSAISQRINYAILLMEGGRFEQALREAEGLDLKFASDFGDMFILGVTACSNYQLGNREKAQETLALMRDKADENIAAFNDTLTCMEEYDEAEQVIIRRLEDSDQMKGMIEHFHTSRPAEIVAVFEKVMMERTAMLRARPAVQEAFNKVGRVIEIDGLDTIWTGY